MDAEKLKVKCGDIFGKAVGGVLYEAMMKVHNIDFCVATSWDDHEVSVSLSCPNRGRVFRFSDDYKHLVMPSGGMRSIESLSYRDVAQYLPRTSGLGDGHEHCGCDLK